MSNNERRFAVWPLGAGEVTKVSLATWNSIEEDDYEEFRLAVVMNGGVSLAIWIGGVAMEMNRLTNSRAGDSSCYGDLLNITKSAPRVDVIAGTSAGGINGGFLGLAAVYGTGLGKLGELWADRGGLLELLRSPMEGQPPSLLKGDGYFLPQLGNAFRAVLPDVPRPAKSPTEAPLDLTITTSVLQGMLREFTDSFGQPIRELEHRGRFHFVRNERTDPEKDDFNDPAIADKLALASRSTASFPFAFEASYVPVAAKGPDPLHPQMQGATNFQSDRFVVDGGVLVNQPVRPALEAIFKQSADRQVRRVLAYVNPDPASRIEAPADKVDNPPTLDDVLVASLLKLPQAQTIIRDLEDLRDHNREARDRRELQPNLLVDLSETASATAGALFDAYRRIRLRRAVRAIAEWVQRVPGETDAGVWTENEFIEAFETRPPPVLDFIPQSLRVPEVEQWDWGLAPLERMGAFALDLLRTALGITPFDQTPIREALRSKRGELHGFLTSLTALRKQDAIFWKAGEQAPPPPVKEPAERRRLLREWAEGVSDKWPPPYDEKTKRGFEKKELGFIANAMAQLLIDSLPVLREVAPRAGKAQSGDVPDPFGKEREGLEKLVSALDAAQATDAATAVEPAAGKAEKILRRLLELEVIYVALTGGVPPTAQEIQLVQISGDTPNGFGGPVTSKDKLTGVQLSHFGAFYKKSWRVNDWIWGRLDGATRLAQAVLGPARLRQLQLGVEGALALIEAASCGPALDQPPGPGAETRDVQRDYLRLQFEKEKSAIEEELAFLSKPTAPLPLSLPISARAIARRLHAEILNGELENLAQAVESDAKAGGSTRPSASSFAARYREEKAASPGGDIPIERRFVLFGQSKVWQERLPEEVGTDLFAATTSRSFAVTASALDVPKLGPARAIARALRGIALTIYALIYGATVGSRFGNWAINAVLATGGALLAISLLTPRTPTLVKTAAALIVVAGIAVAAVRSRLWTFALALGVPLVGAVAFVVARGRLEQLQQRAGAILTVIGLVIATALLGTVRQPATTPPLTHMRRGGQIAT
ncbi:MAG: patatin-like protein, partial [Actinomycetota bacterium]|nr:patatin-like protein [Actinomycetota bacterium]